MARGGARNRSGPAPDPMSLRSAKAGRDLVTLPSEGFDGEIPEFPLPDASERELEIWSEAWSSPQACAWALESWRWPTVAEYARWKALCEREPNAALIAQLHRYRDQIGMTPAGLRENGWQIAKDALAEKRTTAAEAPKRASARDRLKVVDGDGG